MIKPTIQATIFDDSSRKECEAGCGVKWSEPEAITLARQQIKDRFDEEIELNYFDLAKATANLETLEWGQTIKKQNLPLPLLILNDQPRISGYFDFRQLIDAIEVETELGV